MIEYKNKYKISVHMKCDKCSLYSDALITLRDKRKKSQKLKDVHRVCYRCAKRLMNEGTYDFGIYWKKLLPKVYA